MWTEDLGRAQTIASRLDAGTVWINCWLHRQLHMPFGGVKASGIAREGGLHSLDFYSESSTICMKLGDRTPPLFPGVAPPLPAARVSEEPTGRAAGGAPSTSHGEVTLDLSNDPAANSTSAASAAASSTIASRLDASSAVRGRRAMSTTASGGGGAAATDGGMVTSAPRPMGAYAHARVCGELLFLAGIGPRNPADDSVPGGPVEAADGSVRDYDVGAQTRQCIANVRAQLTFTASCNLPLTAPLTAGCPCAGSDGARGARIGARKRR